MLILSLPQISDYHHLKSLPLLKREAKIASSVSISICLNTVYSQTFSESTTNLLIYKNTHVDTMVRRSDDFILMFQC